MNILYAIPNYECDLDCWYCNLKDKKIEYNEDKFLSIINQFYGEIILFGGEPTLYYDRLKKIIDTRKITSITTNLININDNIIDIIQNINIATTYRPFSKWINNLKKLSSKNKNIRVLFTLTDELIKQDPQDVVNTIKQLLLDGCYIESILFEQLLDSNKDKNFYNKVDQWLYDIHFKYNLEDVVQSVIVDQILNGWNFDCSMVKTLEPDGTIKQGCPQREQYRVIPECYNCSKSKTCRPCILQTQCVYPHKFGNEVLNRYDKKKRISRI